MDYPLDGTTNFAHGFPQFCVSFADEHRGRLVYDVLKRELFVAARSHGARLNGRSVERDANARPRAAGHAGGGSARSREAASPRSAGQFGQRLVKRRCLKREVGALPERSGRPLATGCGLRRARTVG